MTGTKGSLNPRILIVSYSYSGNTHQIAKGIQEATDVRSIRGSLIPWHFQSSLNR